jgi:hypothetical protein
MRLLISTCVSVSTCTTPVHCSPGCPNQRLVPHNMPMRYGAHLGTAGGQLRSELSTRADGKQLRCRFRPILAELRPALAGANVAV